MADKGMGRPFKGANDGGTRREMASLIKARPAPPAPIKAPSAKAEAAPQESATSKSKG
jgi:hypothetical protein